MELTILWSAGGLRLPNSHNGFQIQLSTSNTSSIVRNKTRCFNCLHTLFHPLSKTHRTQQSLSWELQAKKCILKPNRMLCSALSLNLIFQMQKLSARWPRTSQDPTGWNLCVGRGARRTNSRQMPSSAESYRKCSRFMRVGKMSAGRLPTSRQYRGLRAIGRTYKRRKIWWMFGESDPKLE